MTEAQRLEHVGDIHGAERTLEKALNGYTTLLSPVHKHTKAASYQLAIFYAEHDRMDNADRVLDWMSQNHVEHLGLRHQETIVHFFRIVELFNGWCRPRLL